MTDREKLDRIREFVERQRDAIKKRKEREELNGSYEWHFAKELECNKILSYIDSLLD